MNGAVPRNIDETDELPAIPRTDPAEAVLVGLPVPVVLEWTMIEGLCVERVQLGVVERVSPLVGHVPAGNTARHDPDVIGRDPP